MERNKILKIIRILSMVFVILLVIQQLGTNTTVHDFFMSSYNGRYSINIKVDSRSKDGIRMTKPVTIVYELNYSNLSEQNKDRFIKIKNNKDKVNNFADQLFYHNNTYVGMKILMEYHNATYHLENIRDINKTVVEKYELIDIKGIKIVDVVVHHTEFEPSFIKRIGVLKQKEVESQTLILDAMIEKARAEQDTNMMMQLKMLKSYMKLTKPYPPKK